MKLLWILMFLCGGSNTISAGIPNACRHHLDWAFHTGKTTSPQEYTGMQKKCGVTLQQANYQDFQRLFKCENIHKQYCNDQGLTFPTTCSAPPCDKCTVNVNTVPPACKHHIDWAFNIGKVSNPQWYQDMPAICGISSNKATVEDFQRYFKCKNLVANDCQKLQYPPTCSKPPCNVCLDRKCCAKESEDVYNPSVCPGEARPVGCCIGLQSTFVPGPNNHVCKRKPDPKPCTGKICISGRNIMVNGQIFYMKGVNWNPVPKGRTHPPRDQDFLHYAKIDAPKMKEAGINVIRSYPTITSSQVLDIFHNNGILVVNPLNPLDSTSNIQRTVNSLKGHITILMWALGNEWNYNSCYSNIGFRGCAQKIREASKAIKAVDNEHPVTSIYGELPDKNLVDSFPDVDAWGLNVYSGKSFGSRFMRWSGISTKPMYMAEYGADSWNARINAVDEDSQAVATKALLGEIKAQSTRQGGPCTGGIIFEWADEWWKSGSPWTHDKGGIAPGGGPYPDKTFNEEYWGLMTIDRIPRKAFYEYKNN
uniref:Glycoside hydrolase family 2 catalytic domain-containing protein n=1 Tax=Clytia hemisphaerica TaxID=252671 RepID=A0A7M6DRN4_9CNID